jgi:hypothetical protein
MKPLEARWYLSLAGHEIGGGTGGITEAYDVICICQPKLYYLSSRILINIR